MNDQEEAQQAWEDKVREVASDVEGEGVVDGGE